MTTETIMVPNGVEFTVSLQAGAAAGYAWQLLEPARGLRLLGSGLAAPPGVPGAPAEQFFRWRAVQPGRHVLNFILKRPWEAEPVGTHTVTVEVGDGQTPP